MFIFYIWLVESRTKGTPPLSLSLSFSLSLFYYCRTPSSGTLSTRDPPGCAILTPAAPPEAGRRSSAEHPSPIDVKVRERRGSSVSLFFFFSSFGLATAFPSPSFPYYPLISLFSFSLFTSLSLFFCIFSYPSSLSLSLSLFFFLTFSPLSFRHQLRCMPEWSRP